MPLLLGSAVAKAAFANRHARGAHYVLEDEFEEEEVRQSFASGTELTSKDYMMPKLIDLNS
jgi:aspartate oxidase